MIPHPRPLTVVMPVYNEEAAIEKAVEEVRALVLDHVRGADLVVVDDGSTDGTPARLRGLAESDPRVRVVRQSNQGHGPAIIHGMNEARGSRVLLVDSDQQIPLDDFPRWWVEAQGAHGVFGMRHERNDPPVRLRLTRLIHAVLPPLFGVSPPDANVPCKLFLRSLWDEARAFIPPRTLAPSLFLALFAARRGYDIRHVRVPHRPRSTGVESLRKLRLATFAGRAFLQLLAFRWRLRRA